MLTSFLTTVRSTSPYRERNLVATLDWYNDLPMSRDSKEIIVVEQDKKPANSVKEICSKFSDVKHMFAPNDREFNKAWGLNIAAVHSAGKVLALMDADILVDHRVLIACIHSALHEYDIVSPYKALIDLDEAQTAMLYDDKSVFRSLSSLPSQDRGQFQEHLCYCGGLYLANRQFYLDSGGMDERFSGWGGEDDAMTIKISAHGARTAASDSRPALHLWHPRNRKSDSDKHYQRNLGLLDACRQYSATEWEDLIADQQETMGNPGKYHSANRL